jgi:hypothetical protein
MVAIKILLPPKSTIMKYLFLSFALITTALQSSAKIWRVNNNVGVIADFTTFHAAVAAAASGDTLYIEASATDYVTNSITLTKRLVVIGAGYFHNPAEVNFPPNPGLQANAHASSLPYFVIGEGANGTKLLGLVLANIAINGTASPLNLLIERCFFVSGISFANATHDGVTVRKCFFNNSGVNLTSGSLTNFVCENNIFNSSWGYLNMPNLTGSTNIVRNNSFKDAVIGSTISNCYIANNIFGTGGAHTFTNCTIKNNLFGNSQALPGTATNNQLSVNMTNVYEGGTTGSLDSRFKLKAGSPALAAGLTVGAVVTPDCGAFGATDPYVLSGMPNIPTIYSLTVPTAIPSGTATMNITFSTRNNN